MQETVSTFKTVTQKKQNFYKGKRSYWSKSLDHLRLPPILHAEQMEMMNQSIRAWPFVTPRVIHECPILHSDERAVLHVLFDTMRVRGKKKNFREVCLSIDTIANKIGMSRSTVESIVYSLQQKSMLVVTTRKSVGATSNYRFTRFLYSFQLPGVREEFEKFYPVKIYRPSFTRVSETTRARGEALLQHINGFLKKISHQGGYLTSKDNIFYKIYPSDKSQTDKVKNSEADTTQSFALLTRAHNCGHWDAKQNLVIIPIYQTPQQPQTLSPYPLSLSPSSPLKNDQMQQRVTPVGEKFRVFNGYWAAGFGVIRDDSFKRQVDLGVCGIISVPDWHKVIDVPILDERRTLGESRSVSAKIQPQTSYDTILASTGILDDGLYVCDCGAHAKGAACVKCGKTKDEEFAWICQCGKANMTTLESMVCTSCAPKSELPDISGKVGILMDADDLPLSKKRQLAVYKKSKEKKEWLKNKDPFTTARMRAEEREGKRIGSKKCVRLFDRFLSMCAEREIEIQDKSMTFRDASSATKMIADVGESRALAAIEWGLNNWDYILSKDNRATEVSFNFFTAPWRYTFYLAMIDEGKERLEPVKPKPYKNQEARVAAPSLTEAKPRARIRVRDDGDDPVKEKAREEARLNREFLERQKQRYEKSISSDAKKLAEEFKTADYQKDFLVPEKRIELDNRDGFYSGYIDPKDDIESWDDVDDENLYD